MDDILRRAGQDLVDAVAQDDGRLRNGVVARAAVLRRRRRLVITLVPVLAAALVTASLVAAVPSHRSRAERVVVTDSEPGPTTTVSTLPSLTMNPVPGPDGWQAVDFSQARLWVPPDWSVATATYGPGCSGPSVASPGGPTSSEIAGLVLVGTRVLSTCPARGSVQLEGLDSASNSASTPTTINGYEVIEVVSGSVYEVPALGVKITVTGAVPSEVLRSLGPSPKAVVTSDGTGHVGPSNWKRVSYLDVGFSVPPSWPVIDSTHMSACGSPFGETPTVYEGEQRSSASCPASRPQSQMRADGVWIQPDSTPDLNEGVSFGYDDGGPTIVFTFHGVTFELGVGDDPTVAHAIFESLTYPTHEPDTSVAGVCPSGSDPRPAPERLAQRLVLEQGNITLDPPRADEQPSVGAETVLSHAGQRDPGITYRLILARYSAHLPAKQGSDGKLRSEIQDRLAWVIYGVPQTTSEGPCGEYIVYAVDALTGGGLGINTYGSGP